MTEQKFKPIPYGRQFINEEDISAVVESLKSDFLTQGPKIEEFEKKFASYVGAADAVAVSNGTTALHLAALALGVNASSRVITTPITFAASANCILYCGGTVEFCDINPTDYLLDLNALEKKLAAHPRGYYTGILPVDLAGYPVNLERLKEIADRYGMWIIEDACHAPGGFFQNSRKEIQYCGNGRYADLAIFSFHPVKHIATGEGGMITTNNAALADHLRRLRTHGITKDPALLQEQPGGWYYEMQELGYNYRMTDFQAALGISQLGRAPQGIARREEIAARYFNYFSTKDYILHQPGVVRGHAYHLYIIQVENRLALYNFLRKENIFCQVHYIPIHTMPYYRNLGWKKGDFPNAEHYYDHCLSLPMFPSLTDDEQQFVMDTIDRFYHS